MDPHDGTYTSDSSSLFVTFPRRPNLLATSPRWSLRSVTSSHRTDCTTPPAAGFPKRVRDVSHHARTVCAQLSAPHASTHSFVSLLKRGLVVRATGWGGKCGENEVTCHIPGFGTRGKITFDW